MMKARKNLEWQGTKDIELIVKHWTDFITMPQAQRIVEEEEEDKPVAYQPQKAKRDQGDDKVLD